ncbi:MAG: hypothetical protein H0S85_01460 [Desulfovibrionaceae bacterium]|jgi:hypothetical protein|nr:hypothetical protein [Desulfovibrionaceae bacterium]
MELFSIPSGSAAAALDTGIAVGTAHAADFAACLDMACAGNGADDPDQPGLNPTDLNQGGLTQPGLFGAGLSKAALAQDEAADAAAAESREDAEEAARKAARAERRAFLDLYVRTCGAPEEWLQQQSAAKDAEAGDGDDEDERKRKLRGTKDALVVRDPERPGEVTVMIGVRDREGVVRYTRAHTVDTGGAADQQSRCTAGEPDGLERVDPAELTALAGLTDQSGSDGSGAGGSSGAAGGTASGPGAAQATSLSAALSTAAALFGGGGSGRSV